MVHWFVWPQMSWATYFPIYPAGTSGYYFCLGFIFVSDPQKDDVLLGFLLWSFDPTTVKLVGFDLWSKTWWSLSGLILIRNWPISIDFLPSPALWSDNSIWFEQNTNTQPESTKVPQTSAWSTFVGLRAVLWLSPATEDLNCELLEQKTWEENHRSAPYSPTLRNRSMDMQTTQSEIIDAIIKPPKITFNAWFYTREPLKRKAHVPGSAETIMTRRRRRVFASLVRPILMFVTFH